MGHKFLKIIDDIPFETLEHLAGLHDCKIVETYPEVPEGEDNITFTISGDDVADLLAFGVAIGRQRERQLQSVYLNQLAKNI